MHKNATFVMLSPTAGIKELRHIYLYYFEQGLRNSNIFIFMLLDGTLSKKIAVLNAIDCDSHQEISTSRFQIVLGPFTFLLVVVGLHKIVC